MSREIISQLQDQIREMSSANKALSLHYIQGHSNTTRTKQYKKGTASVNCGKFNAVLSFDPEKKRITVEPRITMEELVNATLPHGLIPPVVPEFKGITVGGAIMGGAAESGSHRWGIFHDICTQLTFIDGKGNLIQTSPTRNSDLFYGISSSYGSLGLLVSAEISLVPALKNVHLIYHRFSDPSDALAFIQKKIGDADFLDGIIFSPRQAVIVEGHLTSSPVTSSMGSKWYAHHLKTDIINEERLPLFDYLFRYDKGAFWMGSFLFSLPFLARYIGHGILRIPAKGSEFSKKEIKRFSAMPFPNAFLRTLASPIMDSQRLWALLHKAEKWVQERLVIQDFCIPFSNAARFLDEILKEPALFPIWLCPLKGTETPQLFAPHLGSAYFMNFGLYGVPGYQTSMEHLISRLENKTAAYKGRKVLYSRSFYSERDFWTIYSKEGYEALRQQTHAEGIWRGLTDKVLSI